MSILIFFAILFILVLVHELGHFAVAKWTGMRVDEFGIGFPPKLFGIRKGETEYTFNLLPIGGFVKIQGEDGLVEEEARTAEARSFTAKSRWAQTAVLVAGVTMNVLLAWVLFTAAFAIGVQTAVSESAATENAQLVVTSVLPDSPAAEAGLRGGVVVTEVTSPTETLVTYSPSAFSAFVGAHGGEEITLTYRSGETEETVTIVPEQDLIADAPTRAAIGVALAQIETVRQPIHEAVVAGAVHTFESTVLVASGILGLLYDSIRFNADLSQVAGPVGIVGLVGEASAYGVTALLTFTAFISLNLAVINILPFPALDGGRLLFVAIKAVRQKPIKPAFAAALNTFGFILLMLLMVAVTWNDIARLI